MWSTGPCSAPRPARSTTGRSAPRVDVGSLRRTSSSAKEVAMKRSLATLSATALLAAAITSVPRADARTSNRADQVLAWNEISISTLVTAKTPTPEQPIYLAYVHRAVLHAVSRSARHHASVRAATAAAAHDVLVAYFPDQQAVLDADLANSLASIRDTPRRAAGLAIGSASATALVLERTGDGRNGTPLPLPAPGPGVWIPTPPNIVGASSWVGSVRPFTLKLPGQFRAASPPALTSARWVKDYDETRRLGSATSEVRTPAQTETARFWSDGPYVQNQQALRTYVTRHGLGAKAAARLFALADTAAADAIITCWDSKYRYDFWRPFSAIPAGDTDGTPATVGDPTWQPLLATPNHPEYPSAHSCATTAMFTVVAGLTSRHGHHLDIDMTSVTTGTTHHFSSVHQLVAEVSNARVWGGLHWRFSTVAGAKIGTSVARVVLHGHHRLH